MKGKSLSCTTSLSLHGAEMGLAGQFWGFLLFLTMVKQGPALALRKWQKNPRKTSSLLNCVHNSIHGLTHLYWWCWHTFSSDIKKIWWQVLRERVDPLPSPTQGQMSNFCTEAGLHKTLITANSTHKLGKTGHFFSKAHCWVWLDNCHWSLPKSTWHTPHKRLAWMIYLNLPKLPMDSVKNP